MLFLSPIIASTVSQCNTIMSFGSLAGARRANERVVNVVEHVCWFNDLRKAKEEKSLLSKKFFSTSFNVSICSCSGLDFAVGSLSSVKDISQVGGENKSS
jgi:hypothetical protein